MKRFIYTLLLVGAMTAALPSHADAAPPKEEEIEDARFEGYGEGLVNLQVESAALAYFLASALGVVTFGGLFKSAKRTHLD